AELVACAAALHLVYLRSLIEANMRLDIHELAGQHYGAWQRLCCSLCQSQRALVAFLRVEWERQFCQGLAPFILHRTLPATAAAVAATHHRMHPQKAQQQERERASSENASPAAEEHTRALEDLAVLGVIGDHRIGMQRAKRLLQVLRTRVEPQQLAEDWRKALNLLDSRLLDVVDNKL
ncbi:uncharacterized protein LOC34624041, partial [Cyclospora cayetanensis]|uniref:Uncharacterized protein LOC34624041 n=1 Tax=Cyclospora cayetanensis TaxID=88456 RepID=A0A6P6RW11_9EIME